MGVLEGKTALVTGGSRGIGAAIARHLAREGANVGLTYAAGDERAAGVVTEVEALGRRALAIRADSGDPVAVTAAADTAAATFGGIDVLVNNAGIMFFGPLEKMTLAEIDRTFAVNVRAAIVASQAVVPHMIDGGRIITIGSNSADRIPGPGGAVYAASKAALNGLTRGLAHEFGPRGITAVVVQPGPTDTEANPADGPFAAQMVARTPLGRYAVADDIAQMVAFLAGPGGRHVTGTTITLDGGFNA